MNGPRWIAAALVAAGLWTGPMDAAAQDMPDPSLIHGRAIPAGELANGTVTVRVVREAIGGAHRGLTITAASLEEAVHGQFEQLSALSADELLAARYAKFRAMGHLETAPSLDPVAGGGGK